MNKTGHYWRIGEMDGNIWIHYLFSCFLVIVFYEVFKRLFLFKRSDRLFHAIMIVFAMGLFKEALIDPYGEVIDLIFNALGICMAVLSIGLYQRKNRMSGSRKYTLQNIPTTPHTNISSIKIKELSDRIDKILKLTRG
jgi:hypothetical protein